MANRTKPNTGKDPKLGKPPVAAAQANKGNKPSKLTSMAGSKKKER